MGLRSGGGRGRTDAEEEQTVTMKPAHVFFTRTVGFPMGVGRVLVSVAIYRRRDASFCCDIENARGRWGFSLKTWRPFGEGRRRWSWTGHIDRFRPAP